MKNGRPQFGGDRFSVDAVTWLNPGKTESGS